MNIKATQLLSQLQYTTHNAMTHAYHCICHTGRLAYHMLQVGGREEICIIHVVPCCGKRVSFWFDSSQYHYSASGLKMQYYSP